MPNYDYFIKTDTSAYRGEWIAFSRNTIITHGQDAQKVYREAQRKVKSKDIALAKIPKEQILVLRSSR